MAFSQGVMAEHITQRVVEKRTGRIGRWRSVGVRA
jgi:hypothetical protein